MEPLKTLYVKNRTDDIDDISDEYTTPFNVYHLSPSFDSFKKGLWHPDVKVESHYISDKLNSEILEFTIDNLKFTLSKKLNSSTYKLNTEYGGSALSSDETYNNLTFWKSFKRIFKIHSTIHKIENFNFYFNIEYAWYYDSENIINIKVDDEFTGFLNYRYSNDGISFVGFSEPEREIWIPSLTMVDFDAEIKYLQDKKEFFEEVKIYIDRLLS